MIALVSSTTLASACTSERIDLVNQRVVQIQVEVAESFEINSIRAIADYNENQTTIYGKVRRLGIYYDLFSRKRVKVTAIFPNGRVVEHTDNFLVPLHRTRSFRSIYPEANFKVRFEEVLPLGTLLRIKFFA